MANADTLATTVLQEFEKQFGWMPDDLDLALAEPMAQAVCTRLGVELPSLDYPAPYADFAAALDLGGGAAPQASERGLPEVSSEGGPVLAAPAELAARWRGTTGEAPTDYDRCCEQTENYRATEYGGLDWVTIDGSRALVLDLELMTTALPREDGALIVRNWSDTPTEEDIERWLGDIDASSWEAFPGALVLEDGRLVLFDAAARGNVDPAAIETDEGVAVLSLQPGSYGVAVAVHEGLDFIRLSRRQDQVPTP